MSRIVRTSNSSAIYIIALVVIIIAFILLGGGAWIREVFHGSASINMENWNWTQILISLVIGFFLGIGFARRRY